MNYTSETCDQLIQVLKYIKKEDREKIPKDIINFLYSNCNTESTFIYNQALPLEKQQLSKETWQALRWFSERYWHE